MSPLGHYTAETQTIGPDFPTASTCSTASTALPAILSERSKIQTREATDVGYNMFVQFDPFLTSSNVGNPNP